MGLFSTMPWHGCDIPWQSQLSLGTLAGGARPHAYVSVSPRTAHVYTPTTCALQPTCAHVCSPGTCQDMRSDNPPPRQPPHGFPVGDTPLPAHILSLPGSLQLVRFLLTPRLSHTLARSHPRPCGQQFPAAPGWVTTVKVNTSARSTCPMPCSAHSSPPCRVPGWGVQRVPRLQG